MPTADATPNDDFAFNLIGCAVSDLRVDYTVRFLCAFLCPTNRLTQTHATLVGNPRRQTVCRTLKRTSKTHRVIDPLTNLTIDVSHLVMALYKKQT
jgi:hypothetical protein